MFASAHRLRVAATGILAILLPVAPGSGSGAVAGPVPVRPETQTIDNARAALGVTRVSQPVLVGERFTFDDAAVNGLPEGFTPYAGQWSVRKSASAPSAPNVLRQTATAAFPLIRASKQLYADLTLSVSFLPESGKLDQAAGLVFRAGDTRNYYVVRANALEDNVNFYRMREGRRELIAEAQASVARGQWQTLRVACAGDLIRCTLNGRLVLAVRDGTFEGAGWIGLWTKADSRTSFDDLRIEPIELTRSTLQALPGTGDLLGVTTRLAASAVGRELAPQVAALFERLGVHDQASVWWDRAGKRARADLQRLLLAAADSTQGGLKRYGVTRQRKLIADERAALAELAGAKPLLGWLLDGTGDADSLLAKASDDARLLYLQGLIQARMGASDKAAATFRAVLARAPHHAAARVQLGYLVWRTGDFDQARALARAASLVAPGSARPLVLLGKTETAAGKTDAALAAYRKALAVDPKSCDAQIGRGTVFFRQGIFAQAIDEYGRAIALDSADPRGWYNRGLARDRLGRRAAALGDLRRALELGPDIPQVHYDFGRLLAASGDVAGAEAAFRKSIAIAPEFAPGMMGMGWLMRTRGKHAASRAWYERATRAAPDNPDAWGGLGNARYKLGQWKPAADAYTNALALRENWTQVRINRGMARFKLEHFAEAIEDFETARKADPQVKALADAWIAQAREAIKKRQQERDNPRDDQSPDDGEDF